jgi:hypothetical protein
MMNYGSVDSVPVHVTDQSASGASWKHSVRYIDDYPNLAKRKVSAYDKFSLVFSISLFSTLLLAAIFLTLQQFWSATAPSAGVL